MHVVFFTHGPMEEKLRAHGVRTSVVELGRFRGLATGRRAIRRLRAIVAHGRRSARGMEEGRSRPAERRERVLFRGLLRLNWRPA